MKKHDKVVRPKGKKQKVKGPGKKSRLTKRRELSTSNKIMGGAGGMKFKGKTVY